MKETMEKLTQGATRLLVLALGLGLAATGWGATGPVAYTEASGYSKWAYSRIINWRVENPSSTSKQCLSAATVTELAADGTTEMDADGNVSDGYNMAWNDTSKSSGKRFNSGSTPYASGGTEDGPGYVLRFSGAGGTDYRANADATFYPLTFGGLIVESGATGYSLKSENAGNYRHVEFGSKDGTETWFVINEPFTIVRSTSSHSATAYFDGTVNLMLPDSTDIFTLNVQNNIYLRSSSPNPELKFHGAGRLKINQPLQATSSVTLNFANVTRDVDSDGVFDDEDAFIDGDLTIDGDTKFVFPSTLAAYTAYPLCTGTLSGAPEERITSVKFGNTTKSVLLKFSGNKVSYSPVYTATVNGTEISWDDTPESLDNVVVHITGSGEATGLSGSGTIIYVDSGATVDVTGLTSPTLRGSGIFRYTSGYPATVPSGYTYEYVGGDTEGAEVEVTTALKVSGTLRIKGYFYLNSTGTDFYSGSTVEIVTGRTRADTYSNSYSGGFAGTLTIDPDATFVVVRTDTLNRSSTAVVVNVYGNLNFNSARWTVRSGTYHTINLYPGSQVTGSGDGNGVLDFEETDTKVIVHNVNKNGETVVNGVATIAPPIKLRESGHNTIFDIAEGTTLVVQSEMKGSGNIYKQGEGTLKFQNVSLTRKVLGSEGTIELNATTANSHNAAAGSTFSGVLKLTNSNSKQTNFDTGSSSQCFAEGVRPELIMNSTQTYFRKDAYNGSVLNVRDLSGDSGAVFDARYTSGPITYTLDTMQTKDTEYKGIFNSDGTRAFSLNVTGNNVGGIHTLTLSGINTTTNTLTVSDYAKVCFSSTGKWANGIVVVGDNGVLESQNSASIAATLKVKKGATLAFADGDQALAATTYDWTDVSGELTDAEKVKVDLYNLTPSNDPITLIASGVTISADKFTPLYAATGYSASLSVVDGALKVTFSGNYNVDGDWKVGPNANHPATIILTQNSTLSTATDVTLGAVNLINMAGSAVTLGTSGAGKYTFGGLTVPGQITLNVATSLDITGTVSGSGTINVLDGGELTMEDTTCSSVINVQTGGTLKAKGTTTLSAANTSATGSLIEIVDGGTTLGSEYFGLSGNITVDTLATLTMGASWYRGGEYINNHINPYGTSSIDISGTLAMNNKYWQLGSNISVTLRSGASITGIDNPQDGYSLSWLTPGTSVSILGNATIAAKCNYNGAVLNISEDATLALTKSMVTGSTTKTGLGTLDLTAITPTMPITVNAGTVVADEVPTANITINANGTFTLQDCDWTSGNPFSGAGTLELKTTTGTKRVASASSTFAGVVKISSYNENAYYAIGGENSDAPGFTAGPELVVAPPVSGTPGFALGKCYDNASFSVRNFSGEGKIRGNYNNTANSTRTIATTQTRDTEFRGIFQYNSTTYTALTVSGEEVTGVHSLTLSGSSETSAPLTINQYGKVVFASTGSWAAGSVVVNAGGYLECTNANAVTSLTLNDGATLVFPTSSSLLSGISTITFASGTVTNSFPSGVPAIGGMLINWTSASLGAAPAGSFVFDNGLTYKEFNGAYYFLQADTIGLYILKAVAVDSLASPSPTFYTTITAALADNDTVYIVSAPNETVTLQSGKTIVNSMDIDVGNLTVNAPTAEYVSPLVANASGVYSVANASHAATTYYWTGTTDSTWATLGNWKVGASGGPVATRAVESSDSVVFNNGATVTLGADVIVAGVTVNGAVSISGTAKELKTTGNITGTGTLTLSDICLSGDGANITVAPSIHFTNDSEFAGDDAMTINGNVEISGSFKIWGVDHIIAGTAQINEGANFGSGNAWLMINGAATVKGAFTTGATHIKFNDTLTIEAGSVTVDGSNVSVDSSTVSVILAGAGATFSDTRGTPIADNKVSTSVANSYVKKSGNTFSVDTYKTVTVVAGDSTVEISTNGVVVAGSSPYALEAGAISIAVTPTAGYKVTGVSASSGEVTGAGPYVYTVAGDVTITVATEAMGAAVSNVNFEYLADYATARVTATITGDATSATLTYGGNTYNAQVSNGTATFTDVAVSRDSSNIYAPVSYTITTDAHATTGGTGSAVAADTTAWFSQSSENSGAPVNGSWTPTVVNLSTPTNVTDNTFAAATPSTSSRVVLEFNVCFSSTSDENVDGAAQAAIKLAEVDSVTTFMVLTNGNEWAAVSNADLAPEASETYKVVLTIDYGTNAYSVTVGNYAMTNSVGDVYFPLAASRSSVQNIDFAGSGTLTSMKGEQVEGYMVVDNNGKRYASIAEAIAAYLTDPTIAPLKVLHNGTPPSGWKIDEATRNLIKVAKGIIFLAL